jgi:hypothetical protein
MLGQLDGLNKDGATKLAEWREAVLEAAKLLIPDEVVEQAEREGWAPTRLADHCRATDLLAHARLEERLIRRDLAPYLEDGMSWDEIVRALEDRLG